MRIANHAGRAALLAGTRALDIEQASGSRFGPDPQSVYDSWESFTAWGRTVEVEAHPDAVEFVDHDLGTPVPRPSQIFAIGLNYADHAVETDLAIPTSPVVFPKFASSLTGADVDVRLSGDRVDWEAELVVVIGIGGRDIGGGQAWDHVAGLAVGQDLSDRTIQWSAPPAQFGLGKSFENYSPVGPAVVTVDEVRAAHDPDDLRIRCSVTDSEGTRVLQDGTSKNMIFSIPELIARLSAIVELRPGDLIFTGTPSGVGMGLDPPQFLRTGQVLTTEIDGLGALHQRFH